LEVKKNKMNKKKKSSKKVVGIAMAIVVFVSILAIVMSASGRDVPVPPGSNGTYYLDPDNSSAPAFCQNATVDVWINSTLPLFGGTFEITTNPDCGNIVIGSFDDNTTVFNQGHAILKDTGSVLKVRYQTSGFAEKQPGVYHLGNFSMHCNSTDCCVTDLNFTPELPATYITNTSGNFDTVEDNGTFKCLMPPPNITSFAPPSPVSDYVGALRTFNITINQTVNVSWLINGSVVKDSEKNVTEANYTNTSAVVGTWNVSAVVENECGGTNMQTWIWNVLEPPVLVNEFVSDNTTEWIELYNKKSYAISLTGWTIEDNNAAPNSLDGKTIQADEHLVLIGGGTDFSFGLNNPGDIIILKNDSKEVDKVAYGDYDDGNTADNADAPGAGKSAGRHPNGMDTGNDSVDFIVFDIPTPGAPNTIAPTITDFAPSTWISDEEGATREFNITVDQTVDVVWKINGTVVKDTEKDVTEANYTNSSAVAGYWEVTATATNTNGSATRTWWWTVNDTTAPEIIAHAPTGTNVAITANITATFNESMNSSTLNTTTVLVENSTDSTVLGIVTYDSATRIVTFDPVSNLNYNETYNVTITAGVQDIAGNNMSSDFTWNFTTRPEVVEATISIGNAGANAGNTTIVSMMIDNATNVGVVDVYLNYNQSVVMVIDVAGGDFDTTFPNLEHNDTGVIRIGAFQTTNPGLNGTITIANVTLEAVGIAGQSSTLNISVNEFKDATPKGNDIPYRVSNGTFSVNTPPKADAGPNRTVLVNETVQFNGSGSYDPDGEIISYYWDFGDGTNATGVTLTHVYTTNGTYIVTLTVTDNNGAMGSDTCNITVNIPPVADAGPDQTVLVNETVQFNGSGSYDPDGGIVSYFWDFGDGTNGTDVNVTHIYTVNGTFIVTLNVADNHNATDEDICNVTAYWNGDANGDGEVTLFDAMYLAKSVLGITGWEGIDIPSDVSGDGEVTLFDAMYLAKHVLGIAGFEKLK
jgi:PKD repeat protein